MASKKKNRNSYASIKDKEDRIAAEIIACLSGYTFQEALNQLDHTKKFIMNRIVMGSIDFTGYLKGQLGKARRGEAR